MTKTISINSMLSIIIIIMNISIIVYVMCVYVYGLNCCYAGVDHIVIELMLKQSSLGRRPDFLISRETKFYSQ